VGKWRFRPNFRTFTRRYLIEPAKYGAPNGTPGNKKETHDPGCFLIFPGQNPSSTPVRSGSGPAGIGNPVTGVCSSPACRRTEIFMQLCAQPRSALRRRDSIGSGASGGPATRRRRAPLPPTPDLSLISSRGATPYIMRRRRPLGANSHLRSRSSLSDGLEDARLPRDDARGRHAGPVAQLAGDEVVALLAALRRRRRQAGQLAGVDGGVDRRRHRPRRRLPRRRPRRVRADVSQHSAPRVGPAAGPHRELHPGAGLLLLQVTTGWTRKCRHVICEGHPSSFWCNFSFVAVA
jgi:hypothetical protein